jgi:hypothetical protein
MGKLRRFERPVRRASLSLRIPSIFASESHLFCLSVTMNHMVLRCNSHHGGVATSPQLQLTSASNHCRRPCSAEHILSWPVRYQSKGRTFVQGSDITRITLRRSNTAVYFGCVSLWLTNSKVRRSEYRYASAAFIHGYLHPPYHLAQTVSRTLLALQTGHRRYACCRQHANRFEMHPPGLLVITHPREALLVAYIDYPIHSSTSHLSNQFLVSFSISCFTSLCPHHPSSSSSAPAPESASTSPSPSPT